MIITVHHRKYRKLTVQQSLHRSIGCHEYCAFIDDPAQEHLTIGPPTLLHILPRRSVEFYGLIAQQRESSATRDLHFAHSPDVRVWGK